MIRLRQALRFLCVVAASWAALIAATGGFNFRIGDMRISSRSAANPLAAAIAAAVAVVALGSRTGIGRALADELRWWKHRPLEAIRARPQIARRAYLLPALIAVVAIGLDVYRWLHPAPLWIDEETIALNVRDRSFVHLAGALWLGQSAPLGWLAIERTALLALGAGEMALRLVPLAFGAALVAVAVWIGRRWLGLAGAAVLVLLCSFGGWLSHYRFEIKHYTADAAFALLLPALAVWATESDGHEKNRRAAIWWGAAAIGQWIANGAMLVAPACALFLFVESWRRGGRRAAAKVALMGLVWLGSFVLHYETSVRYTVGSAYLQDFWRAQLPPADSGWGVAVAWVIDRLRPLAVNPGGTGLWALLWLSAACGFAVSSTPALAIVFALMPLSAFVFAILRIVPLHERLSLWIVPALYLGVAMLADGAVRIGRDRFRGRTWLAVPVAAIIVCAEIWLCADVVDRGWTRIEPSREYHDNHELDDRDAVRWLMDQRRPGDAIMTTHLAWPAVWWYGGFDLGDAGVAGGRLPDGGVLYEMSHVADPAQCAAMPLRNALAGQRRVLVYIGFPDVPDGFTDLLLRELGQVGAIAPSAIFSDLSAAVVIDLRVPHADVAPPPFKPSSHQYTRLKGCVGVSRALRW